MSSSNAGGCWTTNGGTPLCGYALLSRELGDESPNLSYRGPCPLIGLGPPLKRLLPRECRCTPSPKSAESGGRARSRRGIDCGGVEGFGGPVEFGEVGGIVTDAKDPRACVLSYECRRCQKFCTMYQLCKMAQGDALDRVFVKSYSLLLNCGRIRIEIYWVFFHSKQRLFHSAGRFGDVLQV